MLKIIGQLHSHMAILTKISSPMSTLINELVLTSLTQTFSFYFACTPCTLLVKIVVCFFAPPPFCAIISCQERNHCARELYPFSTTAAAAPALKNKGIRAAVIARKTDVSLARAFLRRLLTAVKRLQLRMSTINFRYF